MYMNNFCRHGWCFLVLLLCLSSCVKEDYASVRTDDPGEIILSVTLPEPMPQGAETRANLNSFDVIRDLNLVVARGNSVSNIYFFETYASRPGDPDITVDGDKAVIRISREQQVPNDARIYLLANYGSSLSGVISSVDGLTAIADKAASTPGLPQACYMFAQAEDRGVGNGDVRQMAAELKRTVAMVTLAVDGSALREGVKIVPRSVSLHNVPLTCAVGNEGRNQADEGNVVETGDLAIVTHWGDLAKGTIIGTHDKENGGTFAPLFLYENMQPDGTGSDLDKDKTPARGRESYCTYIEFEGYYTYNNVSTNKTISGTVKYRYYLGKDGVGGNGHNKFDVMRNTHYQVTLILSDLAVTEGGQLDANGNLDTEGQGNWRVETELSDFNFTVPTNVVNGCGQFIPIEVDANADWSIRSTEGDGSWLWFYKDYGSYAQWNTADYGVTVSNGDDNVILFVQPLDPQLVDMGVYKSSRSVTFTLTSGNQKKQFTLTQYAPLPIKMPKFDDDGNIIEGQYETFWVEAADRYAMPWGFEGADFQGMSTSGAYSMDNMKLLMRNFPTESMSYMPYGTENGGSAMMVASWNDCLSIISSPDSNFDPYDDSYLKGMVQDMWDDILNNRQTGRKYHYSVPSIAEWQYIEKAIKSGSVAIGPNAADVNCRINPAAEYWTSNHSIDFPGESYTYQIGQGLDEWKRGQEYVYHRNRRNALRYRLILTKNPNYDGSAG